MGYVSFREGIYLVCGPPVIVTTRIVTCFSRGFLTKPSFATGILGGGTTQIIFTVLGFPMEVRINGLFDPFYFK